MQSRVHPHTFSTDPERVRVHELQPHDHPRQHPAEGERQREAVSLHDLLQAARATPEDPRETRRRAVWLGELAMHWILRARRAAGGRPLGDVSPLVPVIQHMAGLDPLTTYRILRVYEDGGCVAPGSCDRLVAAAAARAVLAWLGTSAPRHGRHR